jgi:hypothetical protein
MLLETIQQTLTDGGIIFDDKDAIRLHKYGDYSQFSREE